jgi:hypothetical protein
MAVCMDVEYRRISGTLEEYEVFEVKYASQSLKCCREYIQDLYMCTATGTSKSPSRCAVYQEPWYMCVYAVQAELYVEFSRR